jgi:hypothetical protein
VNRKFISYVLAYSLVMLSGCAYQVQQVDYHHEQTKAAILVSDPQVYARASLINDRRQETDYLRQLLTNSEVKADGSSVVKFSPQIIRDLKTVDALSASLGLSLGRSSQTSATNLADQIQVAKLQAQLAVLQKQIEGIQAAAAPIVTIPSPNVSQDLTTTADSTDAHTLTPDVSKLQAAVKDVQAQLQTLAVSGVSGPTAPGNNYQALTDPRDDLIDRQAYRRDIRAALAEAQLDDTHDWGGNALYRLQFQATVLPPNGRTKQWGAAQIKIRPPELTWEQVVSMYYNWLGHITSVLSNVTPGAEHNYDYDRYVLQIGSPTYFNVIDVFFPQNSPQDHYCFIHGSATDGQLRGMETGPGLTGFFLDDSQAPNGFFVKLGTYAVPSKLLDPTTACSSYAYWTDNDHPARAPKMEPADWEFITTEIKRFTPTRAGIRESKSQLGLPSASPTLALADRQRAYFPDEFCVALVEEANCSNRSLTFHARGGDSTGDTYAVKSYTVLPGELAQRLGVTTEASQSLQTALTVAAQLSAASSASLGAGYLSQSDARAEALARQPIIVGFAGSDAGATLKESFFGWLLGPQFAVKDSKTLSLQQAVRSYGVNADISVPGWWAYLTLAVSTAWVRNWQLGSSPGAIVIDPAQPSLSVAKRVTLPAVDAAYDSLTDFIATRVYGGPNSHIFASAVTPNVVPACASTVTFQISGTNIWRANSVLLGGTQAKQISVLPDMNGITAQFEMSDVFGGLVNADSSVQIMPLLVAAERGAAAPLNIYVIGQRQSSNGATKCQSPVMLPTNLNKLEPIIVSSTPQSVCTDTDTFPMIIEGLNLASKMSVTSGVYQGQSSNGDGNRQIIVLARPPGSKLTLTPRTIPIIFNPSADAPPSGGLSTNVEIKDCNVDSKKNAAPAGSKAILVTQSVKLAKDQKLEVKVNIPDSFSVLTIAVRPQVPKSKAGAAVSNIAATFKSASAQTSAATDAAGKTTDSGVAPAKPEIAWTESTPITSVSPGNAVDTTGTIDLSNLSAKVGDKLDVQVEITARPGTKPQAIPADKSLTVSGP